MMVICIAVMDLASRMLEENWTERVDSAFIKTELGKAGDARALEVMIWK